MSWVRRTEEHVPAHTCEPPMREVVYTLPAMPPPPKGRQGNEPSKPSKLRMTEVAGALGDLWRCDGCGWLWRVGRRCDACDAYGPGQHRGQCMVGTTWREATLWQCIRNRRKR